MHREPEVPEAEPQVRKSLGCRARITSKELASTHSAMLVLQDREWLSVWGEVLIRTSSG